MALRGTGSATAGWSRPVYLTSNNYPIVLAGWVYAPVGSNSTSWFGLGGANALLMAGYETSSNLIYFDVFDDTGVEANTFPFESFTPDGQWHHWALVLVTNQAQTGSARIFRDGIEVGLGNNATSQNSFFVALASQTFTALNIGIAPSDGTEYPFDAACAVAEVVVFSPTGTNDNHVQRIQALAAGVNPLTAIPSGQILAYHPLRNSLQDLGPQRIGLQAVASPGDPVFVAHPPLVQRQPLIRRVLISHTAAALVAAPSSLNSGVGSLATAINLAATGASTDTGTGSLLASSLQGTSISRNSATGSLFAATHLSGTGSSANAAVGSFAGTSIPLAGTTASTNTAVGALTTPTILAGTAFYTNVLVDALLRGQPLVAPSTWYVGLVTTLGDPVQAGTEVSGGAYARSAIPADMTHWSGTQGPGSTVASTGQSGLVSNNIAVMFGIPSTDWGTVVGYELWDALTGGNRWLAGKLENQVTIHNGDAARGFAAGSLSVAIG